MRSGKFERYFARSSAVIRKNGSAMRKTRYDHTSYRTNMRRMISPPVTLFVANAAALTLLRAVFYLAFRSHGMPAAELAHAFYLGLKFDARVAAIVSFPLLLISSRAYIAIVETALAIVYAADF